MNRAALSRAIALAVGGAALLAACTTPAPSEPDPQPGRAPTVGSADPTEQVPSALDDRENPEFPAPLIDPELVVSGGPPPDGIPPLDEPRFQEASGVNWLSDSDPVLSLTIGEETRAYPIQVMTWHEIVNDWFGSVPVAVTYCPLCNSGVAFDRRTEGRVLSFGTSGLLYADNLVMYDRQTETLWPQLTGTASIGYLTGAVLEAIPMGAVAWSDFRAAHPDASVLSRNTGFDRPYGTNPYVGYDSEDSDVVFPLPGSPDARLALKRRVIGLGFGVSPLAVDRALVAARGVVEVTVDDAPVVLLHFPGQASALDESDIARGELIGSVVAYSPFTDGRRLHFQRSRGAVTDKETGSTWNALGFAVAGPLSGSSLDPVRYLDTFWFSWAAFRPGTRLID